MNISLALSKTPDTQSVAAGLDGESGRKNGASQGVDGFAETSQAVNYAIVGQRWLVTGRGSVGEGHRRGLQDQQAGTPPGPFGVVGDEQVGDKPVVADVLVHGR